MEVVFIDPEAPGTAGGGIRTYIRLALALCRARGIGGAVYTHTPQAYPGEAARPIGRRPWLPYPLSGLAYRLAYAGNVLWEHARWLEEELASTHGRERAYEFADFQGYAFFALGDPALRPHCLVRVHAPGFLVSPPSPRPGAGLKAAFAAWRERQCLLRAAAVAAPSAGFMREKLPWLAGWKHVPNALPPARPGGLAGDPSRPWPSDGARFLYLGRVEERKGVLPLVRAFARVAEAYPGARLTLAGAVGEEAYAAAVRKAIDSLPDAIRERIAWEPPCPPEARDALLERHTALVAPSLWENSPYSYFEGMAAGLSCIGSATGEMEAVARATGAASPRPGDEEGLARALRGHCEGVDKAVPAAQWAYLESKRGEAEAALIASWRAAAGARP